MYSVKKNWLSGRCIGFFDAGHPAAAAYWTEANINGPYGLQEFRHGKACISGMETLASLKCKDQFQVFAFSTVIQKFIITDLPESGGKYMHQIAPDKFRIRKSDGSVWLTRHSSSRGKCHLLFINRENTAVGYGDFVGIPAKVFNGITKPIEGLLAIWAPVLLVKGMTQLRLLVRILQCFAGGGRTKK